MSNCNEWYPKVASRFSTYLLVDTKVKVKELRVRCIERDEREEKLESKKI
jgi:hypothetical protein